MPLDQTPQQIYITTHDGLALSVWDYGGSGPALLLCHCTGTLARIWDPVVAELGGSYRIIAPDTRGQGDSEAPENREDFAWHLSGRDILSVIDALELGTPLFAVGHSAGAAHVGYALLERPESFSRVALLDGIIGPEELFPAPSPLAEKVRKRINVFPDPPIARERFVAKPPMNSWHAGAVDAYIAHALKQQEDGQWALKCPGEREAIFYELGGAHDLFAKLGEIETPALFLAGADSYVRPLVEVQHGRTPRSEFLEIQGAGHFIPQEKPAETAAALRHWFSVV